MENEYVDPWFSPNWFAPATFRGFTWEFPVLLYAVVAVIALFIVRLVLREFSGYRFYQKLPVAVTTKELKNSPFNLIRLLHEILLLLVLALVLTAMARPQSA